ncbi:efflux RND transporter periplasmic adaptor subunit [Parabacteroides sp.]
MKIVNYMGILLLLGFLPGCSEKGEQQEAKKEIPVKVVQIANLCSVKEQNYVGTVEELSSSSLSFQVMGNVEKIVVREGQRVEKGQLLASLDRATLQNTYDATHASLSQAQDAYERMKVLYDNKSLPEMKWVEVQSKLQQAQSMERIARKNLEDASLYAPFGGVIGKRVVEPGENVVPGAPVLTLLDIHEVYVRVPVPEKEIAALDNQKVFITVAALDGQSFEGQITEKGIVANPLSHTYDARIRLANKQGRLMPGMVCRVGVQEDAATPVISIPNNAVQISHLGDNYVWCVDNGKAKARRVTAGALTAGGIQITNGLKEGDLVITDGYQKVSENMKVKVQ